MHSQPKRNILCEPSKCKYWKIENRSVIHPLVITRCFVRSHENNIAAMQISITCQICTFNSILFNIVFMFFFTYPVFFFDVRWRRYQITGLTFVTIWTHEWQFEFFFSLIHAYYSPFRIQQLQYVQMYQHFK